MYKRMRFFTALLFTLLSRQSQAINLIKQQGHEDEPVPQHHALLPYAFYNDSTDFAVAAAFFGIGYLQPQTLMVTNAFVSTNDSKNLFFTFKIIV